MQRDGDYDFTSCDKYDGLGEMKLRYAEDTSGGVPTVGEIKPIANAIPTLASFWQFCKEIDIGIEGMTMRENLLQPEQVKTVTGHLLIDWWKKGATDLKRKQLSNILEEHDIPASGDGKFVALLFYRRFPHDFEHSQIHNYHQTLINCPICPRVTLIMVQPGATGRLEILMPVPISEFAGGV